MTKQVCTVFIAGNSMNSSELMTAIKMLSGGKHNPAPEIDIELLCQRTGQKMTAVVAMLTELEQRDLLKLNLLQQTNAAGEPEYSGTVSIQYPPDALT